MTPAIALQMTVFERLQREPGLTALLGENRIFDDVPPKTDPPYLLFGSHVESDWSSDAAKGSLHDFNLEIWSPENGRKTVVEIAAAARLTLEALVEIGTPYQIAYLEHLETATARDAQTGYFRATVRFRTAVEEIG
jgi:hypothetical protein